jgi:MoxR-vWA-beta-propeller ternary system domain bpX2
VEKGGNATRLSDRAKLTALPWVVRLPRGAASAVAATLRLRAGITGCFIDEELWVRGEALDEMLDRALLQLAPLARYAVSNDGDLVRAGNLLPEHRMPEARWVPLPLLLHADRPTAALPAGPPSRVAVTIVRGGEQRPAAMLRVALSSWAAYAESAPAARLARLRFAATIDQVLIAGDPLPPLAGTRLWESGGIVVPCGFALWPAVDAATLRRALALGDGDLALFNEDGTWELVPAGAFVPARRSAVRLTAARNVEGAS